MAFNLLLVFLPVAGILYLGSYEQKLLGLQRRALQEEARLLAAAVASAPVPGRAAQEILLAASPAARQRQRIRSGCASSRRSATSSPTRIRSADRRRRNAPTAPSATFFIAPARALLRPLHLSRTTRAAAGRGRLLRAIARASSARKFAARCKAIRAPSSASRPIAARSPSTSPSRSASATTSSARRWRRRAPSPSSRTSTPSASASCASSSSR